MGPCLFLLWHLFCLSHRKPCFTKLADNVGLKICLLDTSNSMSLWHFFPLVETEVVPGWTQQPITDFTWPWDDFMVHDVNSPLDYGLSHTQSDCNEIIGQSYIHIPFELPHSAEAVAVGTLTSITDSYICSLQTIVSTQDLILGLSTVD